MNPASLKAILAHTWEMIQVRPRIMKNWMGKFNSENWLSFTIMIGLVFCFWVGGFFFFTWLGHFFHTIPVIGDILINRMIAFLFLALFLMTVFSDLVTALSTMYMSRDLPLLHHHPISPVAIFMEKYIQTVFYGAWAVVVFGLPIFIAYGYIMEAPWYFYPIVLLSNIPFLVLSAGVAILATLILGYLVPANRARTMIIALYGLSAFGVALYIRMLGAKGMVTDEGFETGVEQYLFNLQLTTNPFMPSYWITQVYTSAIDRNLPDLFFYLALLIVSAGLVIQVGCQLAQKIYYPGWTKATEAVAATVSHRKFSLDRTFYAIFKLLPTHIRAVVVKDIKIFWRDLTQWGQFTLLLTLVLVYLFNTRHVMQNTGFMNQEVFNIPLHSLVAIFNLAMVGFVLANMAMRFVFTMISLEGRIIWVIRSSPVKLSTLFWIKFWLALTTMLLVGGGLIGLANYLLIIDPVLALFSTLVVVIMSIALTSLAMGMGAMFPTFNVENPMQLTTGMGSILTVVFSLVYIIATIFLAAQPIIPYYYYRTHLSDFPWWSVYLPAILGVLMNMAVIILPIRYGIRRLQHQER